MGTFEFSSAGIPLTQACLLACSKVWHIHAFSLNRWKEHNKSKACNFMNVLEMQSLLCPFTKDLSLSSGVFPSVVITHSATLQRTESQEGSMGMLGPHRNQLYTGSKAFISAQKLWMLLILRDELPQPNEKERERRGEQESEWKRKSRRISVPRLPRGAQ